MPEAPAGTVGIAGLEVDAEDVAAGVALLDALGEAEAALNARGITLFWFFVFFGEAVALALGDVDGEPLVLGEVDPDGEGVGDDVGNGVPEPERRTRRNRSWAVFFTVSRMFLS